VSRTRLEASLALAISVLAACSHAVTAPLPPPPTEVPVERADAAPPPPFAPAVDASVRDGSSDARPSVGDAPTLSLSRIADVLFATGEPMPSCGEGDDRARAKCLIAARYAADPRAAALATDLFERTGDVAGVSPPETMEGGWRGTLHLVPALPVGKDRVHLAWVAGATRDFDAFFDAIREDGRVLHYVWRGLSFRFMRSVAARTPSAYAIDWTIAYNVAGSLNTSADAVRELLFHESFHLNDQAHGDWSGRALRATFDAIMARCGARIACLAPYTPTDMLVRGGTYYAFQPNNGDAVHEYAAELAVRYYREQRAALDHVALPKRWKCGPPENARAWSLIVAEFFGGIDRTGPCKGP